MKLPEKLRARLLAVLISRVAERRPPDYVIGGDGNPYLKRWWVIPRNPVFNVYLHHFLRSDDDRALHDHPWANLSILLKGRYIEHMPVRLVDGSYDYLTSRQAVRWEGDMVARGPKAAHRIELFRGIVTDRHGPHMAEVPVWTLFITGPRIRQWGFWCPQGWRHWREFTAGENGELIGKGCD